MDFWLNTGMNACESCLQREWASICWSLRGVWKIPELTQPLQLAPTSSCCFLYYVFINSLVSQIWVMLFISSTTALLTRSICCTYKPRQGHSDIHTQGQVFKSTVNSSGLALQCLTHPYSSEQGALSPPSPWFQQAASSPGFSKTGWERTQGGKAHENKRST